MMAKESGWTLMQDARAGFVVEGPTSRSPARGSKVRRTKKTNASQPPQDTIAGNNF